MSFFNLNNFDCLVLNGITTRFTSNEVTKWLNVILYIEKPKKKIVEPERKYVVGEGISLFRREKHHFILSGYCENSKFGLYFCLNKKYNKLNASINYQGFLKNTPDGSQIIELVCNEAAGFLIIDKDLTIDSNDYNLNMESDNTKINTKLYSNYNSFTSS